MRAKGGGDCSGVSRRNEGASEGWGPGWRRGGFKGRRGQVVPGCGVAGVVGTKGWETHELKGTKG